MVGRVRESTARATLKLIMRGWSVGELEARWPDGSTELLVGRTPGDRGHIEVNNPGALATALLNDGSIGLGASYVDGAWNTPDLAGFLTLASANVDAALGEKGKTSASSTVRRWWDKRPSFSGSDQIGAIGDHYNLGNEFYAHWLDETMTYSSAIFEPSDSLQEAQYRKYERLCGLLELQSGDRVLEIGCGWGGFSEYAASRYGVHVTGLTLSEEMATFAKKRLANAGLADLTDIKLQDFRDERAMYDKVVSIEMIESVDETQWGPLFHSISRAIPPGGIAAMQAITIDERYYDNLIERDDFIKRFIFPGGALPTVNVLRQLAADAGMEWTDASMHGLDYAATLEQWGERFEAAWPAISDQRRDLGDRFRRMWRYYLAYCEAGFRRRRIDGIQCAMRRPV
ncbi:MAG: class I SAM-dependent methyltransferase [Acidimicrobiia bacterium]